jgi:hypothetical protein
MRATVANVVACLNIAGAFPSWAYFMLARPWLPKNHPWRKRRFSLRDWHACETPLCRILDVALVAGLANFAISVALLTR